MATLTIYRVRSTAFGAKQQGNFDDTDAYIMVVAVPKRRFIVM